ncbi:MAG: sigma-70 family RNA polymerase sigma factor [Flavobacteriales bacterium]|nr:sigma-70 family RNA polymerase sigma factor [Flavobacteriales bacterium]
MEEHQAITLARSGDQRAIAWLVGQYQHMVYTVTHRVLRNEMDAEEATQDTFVKAVQGLHAFQGGSRFSTWLYSVAYRAAISRLRQRRSEDRSLDEVEGHPGEPRTEAQASTTDRSRALEHALSQLAPEDAAVMTFRYLHEMSVEEIVTATGLTASNVKVKLHRSRKKMLEVLHDHLKEEVWTLWTE